MTPTPARTVCDRRRLAGLTAAVCGGVASLSMALLGPTEPPVGPPPTRAYRRVDDRRGAVTGTPLYECHTAAFGLPAYLAVIGGGVPVLERARARLRELDHKWAAHDPHSEVARISRTPGVMLATSVDTVLLADLATRQPTADARNSRAGVTLSAQADGRPHLLVDARHRRVGLDDDTALNLDPLAAALAVDLILADILDDAYGACVVLGTAARVTGAAPVRAGWSLPARPTTGLRLRHGAVAGASRHRTAGSAVPVGLRYVTVVAEQAWQAQQLADTACGLPVGAATALLADTVDAARLIDDTGTVSTVGDWSTFLDTTANAATPPQA